MTQSKAYAIDFAPFVKERTNNFTGRDWVFGKIDAWLGNKEASRVFLLTGEPGSGKTAIAARLAQYSAGEAKPPAGLQKLGPGFLRAVHFCSATASDWTDPRTFARSISLQLAAIPEFALALKDIGDKEINVDVQISTGAVADGAAVTGVLIRNLVIQGLNSQEAFNRIVLDPLRTIYNAGYDRPIVMVVDSLDEALASATDVTVVDLLAGLQGLDSRVRLILTSRAEPRVENRFFGASGLFLSDPAYTAANDRDIIEYVAHRLTSDDRLNSKVAALPLAQAAVLPDQITGKAEGNFLYGVFLLNAVAGGQQALDALDTLPPGLDGLYYISLQRLIRLGKKDWSTVYKPVLGVLSVAQEPMTPAQVQAYTSLPGDAWEALLDLRQFVEVSPAPSPTNGDEELEDRYRLYHQSVVDFLRRRQIVTVVDGQKKRYDNVYRVVAEDWHKRIVASYRGNARSWKEVEWSRCDIYGLTHLPAHLDAAGQVKELHSLLSAETEERRNVWYQAKDAVGDTAGYLADIRRAWRLARAENPLDVGQSGTHSTALECRYTLMVSSLSSLTQSIPPALLLALVRHDIWTVKHALAYLRQYPDKNWQVEALAELVMYVDKGEREQLLREALTALPLVNDEKKRDFFASLFSHYPAPFPDLLVNEFFSQIASFQKTYLAGHALQMIESYLPSDILEEVLARARQLGVGVYTLATLAHRLPDPQRQMVFRSVLEEGKAAQSTLDRNLCFLAIAQYQSSPELDTLRESLLKAARMRSVTGVEAESQDAYSKMILENLLPYLPQAEQEQVLDELLLEEDRAWKKLATLAAQVPMSLRGRVLSKAQRIADPIRRLGTLADLASYLEGEQRSAIVKEVMEDVLSPTDHPSWLDNYTERLAPYLSPELVLQTLVVARRYPPSVSKSLALTYLAATFSDEARDAAFGEVLQSIRDLGSAEDRNRVWPKCVSLLSKRVLLEALAIVRGIGDEISCIAELPQFLVHLPPPAQIRAFDWATNRVRGLGNEFRLVKFIIQLAPNLPPQLLPRALGIARGLEQPLGRVETLLALAPQCAVGERQVVFEEVMEAIGKLDQTQVKIEMTLQLAYMLPSDQQMRWRSEAMVEMAELSDLEQAAPILAKLHTLFPDLESERMILDALQRPQPYHRGRWVMPILASHLPEFAVRSILLFRFRRKYLSLSDWFGFVSPETDFSFGLGFAIDDHEDAAIYSALTARLAVLGYPEEAYGIMLEMPMVGKQIAGLALLAPYLADDLLLRVVQKSLDLTASAFEGIPVLRTYEPRSIATQSISHSSAREYVLAGLVPELARRGESMLLQECIRALREPEWRVEALAEAAPYVQGEEKEKYVRGALSAIQEHPFTEDRRFWLKRLVPQLAFLPISSQVELLQTLLTWMSGRARQDTLPELYCLAPVLIAVGGTESVAQILLAIENVFRWWP